MKAARRFAPIALAFVFAVLPAAAVAHSHRPVVRFAFDQPGGAEIGTPVRVEYRTTRLPARAKLLFQRSVGTRHAWRTVTQLRAGSGSTSTSPKLQGVARYRIAVIAHRRTLAQTVHRLNVYAPDQLATVLGSGTDTVQIGGSLFRYLSDDAAYLNGGDYCLLDATCHDGDPLPVFRMQNSTCRSMSLTFALKIEDDSESTAEKVTVVSEKADPTSVVVPVDGTAQLVAPVAGDAELDIADQSNAKLDDRLYLNGTADCYTPSGTTGSGS